MRIEHIESSHSCAFSTETGLPISITYAGPNHTETVELRIGLSVEVGGTERREATGGLEYIDTDIYETIRRAGESRSVESNTGIAWCVPIEITMPGAPLRGSLVYRLNRFGPALSFGLSLPGGQSAIVRNIRLNATFTLGAGSWNVTAPGNCVASDTPLEVIVSPIGVSPIGGLRGSSGLIHLQTTNGPSAIALWVDDDTEVPEIEFSGQSSNTMLLGITTNFAADLSGEQSNDVQLFSLDLSAERWTSFSNVFDGWMRSRGLTSPAQPPEWSIGAMIYGNCSGGSTTVCVRSGLMDGCRIVRALIMSG
jgi:hypothetical protein